MTTEAPLFGLGPPPLSPITSPSPASSTKTIYSLESYHQNINERLYHLQVNEKIEDGVEENEKVQNESEGRCKVNKRLLLYKAFYFLFFGAVGSLFPYLAVFYKQLYLSAQQVGFLIGIRPFIQMCAGPLWGALADTYNVKKMILLLSILAWLGTNYSISIVRIPPEIACNKNFTIAKLPEVGRITEVKSNPVLEQQKIPFNSSSNISMGNQTDDKEHAFFETNKRPIEELVLRKRDFDIVETESESKNNNGDEELVLLLFSRSIGRENVTNNQTVNSTTHRHKRHVSEKLLAYHLSNLQKGGKGLRVKRHLVQEQKKKLAANNQLWGRLNITKHEQLLPLQRLLAADELEEEFDSLNTDDEYPWPIDTIASSQSTNERENSRDALRIFIVLIIITVIGTVLASPAATLADTATLENLGEKTYQYGYQRLWGSFGWGLCAFIVGAIVSGIQKENCNTGRHVDYILSFYVYAAMMGVAFLCAVFFKFDPVENGTAYTESLWEALKMFCDCQHVCFVVTLLCNGAAMGFIHTFLFWHLHDLGGTQFLFSVIAATQCISEVIMYLVASYLILKIGCDTVLYIGLFSNIIRLALYSIIRTPVYSIPLEILHGVSSASIWTSAICYIGLIPGTPVTLQALLHGLYWGLGHGGGGIVGGVMVAYLGAHGTFSTYGIICTVNFVLVLLLKYWAKIITLLGNYQFVENIPAGTYVLTTMSTSQQQQAERKNDMNE